MPFYRIVIWTRKRNKPFQGIREIENHNITAVHGVLWKKAEDYFHSNFIDCETQMLPKTCTAIKKYLARKNKNPSHYSINFKFRQKSKQCQVHAHTDHYAVSFTDAELVRDFGALLIFGLDKTLRSSRVSDAADLIDLVRAISAQLK